MNEEAKREEEAERKAALAPPVNEEPVLTLSTRYLPGFVLSGNSTADDYLDYFLSADHTKSGLCENKLLGSFGSFSIARACESEATTVASSILVRVTGLSAAADDKMVEEAFSEYGKVVQITRKGNTAIVKYADAAGAAKAVQEGDGRIIDNADVTVTYAQKAEAPSAVVPGRTDNVIALLSVRFLPRVRMQCAWRLGASFTDGGAILINGNPTLVRPAQNLQWNNNWFEGKALETDRLTFGRDKWQTIEFLGITEKSDNTAFKLEADCGSGWAPVTAATLKKEQMKGWKTRNVYLNLNRGHGNPLHSIIETGEVGYGTHQPDWTLDDEDTENPIFRRFINFGTWFHFVPSVQVFITRADTDAETRTRVFARVDKVTSTGFVLAIGTTRGTKIYQLGVSWIAYTARPLEGTSVARGCYAGEDGDEDWTLNSGSGRRSLTAQADFNDALARAPKLAVLGVDLIDASPTDVVFDATLTSLNKKGFDLNLATDYGGQVYAERVCVLAVSPAEREMDAGEELLNWQTAPGWELDHGTGLREFRMWVKFATRFDDRPEVLVTVTGLELEGQTRFDVHVTRVQETGFELHVSTWDKTFLHAARVRWLATSAGQKFQISKAEEGAAPSNKCTCADAQEDAREEEAIRSGKQTTKSCACVEDTVGARKPVYLNYAEGFGGALEFMSGSPKQQPVFFAFKRATGAKALVPLYYYTNSQHEDRLYTTKYFEPTDEWHGGSVAMYVLGEREPGAVPLYRFYDATGLRHRYVLSTDMFERRNGLYYLKDNPRFRKDGAFRYEGIQCYVYPYEGQ